MITFKQFVESLGEHAKKYTPEKLRRLHADVRKMAGVLIAIHKKRSTNPEWPDAILPADRHQ